MGLRSNPTQRQRRLGMELRRLRTASGLTTSEAARYVDLAGTHLSHIEGGRTRIPEAKLRSLARIYGCHDETFVETLVSMSETGPRAWWQDFSRDVDARARDLAELEAGATSFSGFEAVNMPGLLQSPEYVEALLQTADHSASAVARFRQFRLQRQEVLTRQSPPRYHAIIHEAALHMHFVDVEVQRRQLTHLLEVSELPHVTIQFVPFKAGPLPAVGSPFVVFRGIVSELDTVYVEHDLGADFLADKCHTDRYSAVFDRLASLALPPLGQAVERQYTSQRDSLSLLQHLLYIL
jgi:transcriptional regulator with XRE-family HTH domain